MTKPFTQAVKTLPQWSCSRLLKFFVFIAALCIGHAAYALKGNTNSHDPSALIKDGNRYWQFTTGDGIYAAYSTDLISWTAGPERVFPIGTWPSWINSAVPGFNGHFWAPDVIYMNGLYHLYYSASTFGSSRSAIGLVTNPTLDPNSPSYKWTDQGMVVSSDGSSDAFNAIDPALFRDSDGRVWMSYGSFFGGLAVVEINPSNGKILNGSPITHIAGGGHADWEAPYIIREGNYYFLFANRGSCCKGTNSTYKIVVGRSTNIRGPYLDQNGVALTNGGGTLVLGNAGRYIGPGHFGLLRENGSNFVSIHYYDDQDGGNAKLDIINMGFINNWPFLTRDWIAAGQYKITSKHSGKVWDAWGCTGAQGQAIAQGNWGGYDCQKWNFTPLGEGVYRIANALGGRVADVSGCNANNGTKLQLWDWLNNNCQKFKIERASDGSHILTSMTGNRVVEVPRGSTVDGQQLAIWDYNSRNHQRWWIDPTSTATAQKLAAIVSTTEENAVSSAQIYPNPSADGSFNLLLDPTFEKKSVELTVVDMQGKSVYRELLNGQAQTGITANLMPGTYVVRLRSEARSLTKKLIIMN